MPEASSRRRILVLALLMLVIVISTVDKLVFAFAGPALIHDLNLTPVQFGLAGSAFFFLYSASGILVGLLSNRVPARWLLAGMTVVWALAQFVVTMAGSFNALLFSRLLLGAGTGPGTAVTQHAAFKWFESRDRLVASTMIQLSLLIGGLLAGATLPLIVHRFGWRPCYLALGIVSAAWTLVWLTQGREGTTVDAGTEAGGSAKAAMRYRELLRNPSFLAVTAIGFVGYLPNVLGFSWLAVYLQQGVGLAPVQMAVFLSGLTICLIVANLTISLRCRRAFKNGSSFRGAMVVPPMLACALGGLAFVLLAVLPKDRTVTLALYAIGSIAINLLPAFGFAIVGHIAPAGQRGGLLAIHNGIVTTAGVIAPAFIGWLIARQGGDVTAGMNTFFLCLGAVAAVAGVVGGVFIDPDRTRRVSAKRPAPTASGAL